MGHASRFAYGAGLIDRVVTSENVMHNISLDYVAPTIMLRRPPISYALVDMTID